MCCYSIPGATAKLMRRFGKRKTVRLWKTIESNGMAEHQWKHQQYGPGVHTSNYKGEYRIRQPRGIHVYLKREVTAFRNRGLFRAVAVICHRDDLIRTDGHQAVFTQITIRRKDWAVAGLPVVKRGKP